MPEDQVHVVKVGTHFVKVRSGPLPEPLHAKVGKTLSEMSDAFPQKDTEPARPSTPPQDAEFAAGHWGLPSTSRKLEFNYDVETPRNGPSSSTIRRATSTETSISSGSTVRSPATSNAVPQYKGHVVAVETRLDGRPSHPSLETDFIASSSLPTRTPHVADAYLHPSSAVTATPHHRPTRRNTTGSVVVQPPPRPTRQLTGHKHMSSQPAHELSDHLDSDILEQADQIRRERLSKRAKAQQEAEAALTRPHAKRAVFEEEKVLVGNLIGEDHVNYVLMYNMLTGIRIGVSRCQAKVKRPLTEDDFTARHKFSFDM
jgi:1-phosphatidylinositol-4-phosphate 5-kinase